MSFVKNMFSSPKAPEPVNAGALVQAQSGANKDTARLNAKLNRMDSYGPTGSVTYQDLGDDRWSVKQTLSPDQQKLYDGQMQIGQGVNDAAQARINQLDNSKFSLDGIQGFQGNISYDGLTDMPNMSDLNGAREAAETASFNRAWDRMNPTFEQEEQALQTKLANQGIVQGSDAYNREMDNYARRKNDARIAAGYDSVNAGQSMMSNQLANALMSRQQGISERTAGRAMNNEARANAINDRLLERSQPLNELAAFLQGSPAVNTPQPIGGAQVGAAAPDVGGAYGLAAQTQMNQYNQQMGAQGAMAGGMIGLTGSLGSAAILR